MADIAEVPYGRRTQREPGVKEVPNGRELTVGEPGGPPRRLGVLPPYAVAADQLRSGHDRELIEVGAPVDQQHVGEVVEAALGGYARLQLSHGTFRCIAWICEKRESLGLALFIHLLERGDRHEKLASNFETFRDTRFLQLLFGN